MQLEEEINRLMDSLVPRGGKQPKSLHVSIEEYLSRLANFNRKLIEVKYRMECWVRISSEHKQRFIQISKSNKQSFDRFKNDVERIALNVQTPSRSTNATSSFSLRDNRLENEFEVLLYSISSSLSALTRVIACFLKGSTDLHSHSRIVKALSTQKSFKTMKTVIDKANFAWINEVTDRRDAATHYVALSLSSTITRSKSNADRTKHSVIQIGITQKPLRYVPLWEDDIPTIGGTFHKSSIVQTKGEKRETHELLDARNNLIVQRESPLPDKPTLIDGRKYVQHTYDNYKKYIHSVLQLLKKKL